MTREKAETLALEILTSHSKRNDDYPEKYMYLYYLYTKLTIPSVIQFPEHISRYIPHYVEAILIHESPVMKLLRNEDEA